MSKLRKSVFNLTEIAAWPETGEVSLPTVQRGFVWRPSQIENLWDSLLRGFPAGAFVLSSNDSGQKLELLDGQQRATAICLGFGRATFRDSQQFIRVFIDLEKPKPEDNRKYLFRVITKSHPWGYQKNDNTKTLTANNIREAMNRYGTQDYLREELDRFYPHEAELPVPFNLFLQHYHSNAVSILQQIEELPYFKEKKEKWQSAKPENNTEPRLLELIQEIVDAVKLMLCPTNGFRIPALYLNLDRLITNGSAETDPSLLPSREEANPQPDEIENLFVRLNAGGTPLRGEELNYSILKAHLAMDVQEKIEASCGSLIKPARFITIAYRLHQLADKNLHTEALRMNIKPKQFQHAVSKKEELTLFQDFLLQLVDKEIIAKVGQLLTYHQTNCPYGLPYLLVRKIANVAPELMLMLFYRLWVHQDHFEFNTPEHKKMIGMLTLFLWLGKGEKQRDHSKLLRLVWPSIKEKPTIDFWSSATVQRAAEHTGIKDIRAFFTCDWDNTLAPVRIDQDFFSQFRKSELENFANTMFSNRDVLLYAQRNFLGAFFDHQQFELDDTNVPFDWDHLFPHSLTKNKKRIAKPLRQLYHTIGNFRAWPYALNRMDQDHYPAQKLTPLASLSKSDKGKQSDLLKWEQLLNTKPNLNASIPKLKKHLCDWSFCTKDWVDSAVGDLKKDWKVAFSLIWKRNQSLLYEWYQSLEIAALTDFKTLDFGEVLDHSKWRDAPKEEPFATYFDAEEKTNWLLKKPLTIDAANQVYLYLIYPANNQSLLAEDVFEFGIFQEKGTWIASLNWNDSAYSECFTDHQNYLQQYFTLLSSEKNDVIKLLHTMVQWLNSLPVFQDGDATEFFTQALRKGYRDLLKVP